jgi:hypothetical protein
MNSYRDFFTELKIKPSFELTTFRWNTPLLNGVDKDENGISSTGELKLLMDWDKAIEQDREPKLLGIELRFMSEPDEKASQKGFRPGVWTALLPALDLDAEAAPQALEDARLFVNFVEDLKLTYMGLDAFDGDMDSED